MKPPEHENCGSGYVCLGCGKSVCPRCEVSPGEAEQLCPDCWWTEDPESAA